MENQLIESNESSDDISAILGSVRGRIINELSINEKSMDEETEAQGLGDIQLQADANMGAGPLRN